MYIYVSLHISLDIFIKEYICDTYIDGHICVPLYISLKIYIYIIYKCFLNFFNNYTPFILIYLYALLVQTIQTIDIY